MKQYEIILMSGTIGNILQLIGLIIVFIIILFATYYVSRWVGKSGLIQNSSSNIRVVETFRLSQTKYLQIIKVGEKRFFLIAVSKDDITYISELNEEDITIVQDSMTENNFNFADILKKITSKDK